MFDILLIPRLCYFYSFLTLQIGNLEGTVTSINKVLHKTINRENASGKSMRLDMNRR